MKGEGWMDYWRRMDGIQSGERLVNLSAFKNFNNGKPPIIKVKIYLMPKLEYRCLCKNVFVRRSAVQG